MSVPARVSVVTLGVADVVRATEFYEALGWKPSSASVPGLVTFFDTAGGRLALYGSTDLTADAGVLPRAGNDFRGVAVAINVDRAEEVDEALRAAVQAGATLAKAGVETEWGGYLGYFTDPDGHLWEVCYNPGFPNDANGVPQLP
ncbi:VOC family protein [Spirilliplanes yamanashiensis]|uniref:Glyoxalase n=1 Tax=Spirilliplanes yamanashiensis TaxID=42233 RepID=A0A8J3YE45_9ACTN|nr:VOC family protein [Spirilliplanes yamanashiensis]MDP9816737.1 catechol 2,3-dioxygenase-like lactoylglutathione lyase family enzyme [Spirilliplanes yamanashiensis]GIJ06260.1 glyoxalase [Spirilliplanes yamanashiensis]